MKFIFFTDSHFHMFTNYSKPDEEYGNDRFKEQIETLQKVFDLARENKAKVIFGGNIHSQNKLITALYTS
ncbi:exonuclease [Staphylococcus phage vB_SauH_SPJ2]|nr:exonuclease [Staphylococcus phage vB_SauH_SPJ2]